MSITRRDFLAGPPAVLLAALPPRAARSSETGFDVQVIGDWGEAGSAHLMATARQMQAEARLRPPRFVVTVGDNFYSAGVSSTQDALWKEAFEDIFTGPELHCPWHPVLGNHDHRGAVEAEIAFGAIDPRWQMPARYYSRSEPIGNGAEADFFFIDTNPIAQSWAWQRFAGIGAFEAQLDWLEAGLAASRAAWKIVVGHHPVVSGGQHGGSPALQSSLRPLLERYRVALYLAGHNHCLEDIADGDVRYLTSGSAAKTSPVRSIEGTRFAAAERGFLAVHIDSGEIAYRFIGSDGTLLHSDAIGVPKPR